MENVLFENAVALDSKIHASHKLKRSKTYAFARNVLSAPLSISEVIKASREFPIFFPNSGKFLPVAQMGFKQNGNLYINDDNQWTARYVPAHIRRFPFVLGEKEKAGEYLIMVESDRMSTNGDGEPLFVNGAVPAGGAIERARTFLVDFQRELKQTEAFLKPLLDSNILVSKRFTMQAGDKVLGSVTDLQIVDSEKLAGLDDATLADWVRNGLMGIILAHLNSLENWNGHNALTSS